MDVSGTLEHRVADMRTTHSGSLSTPHIISTHVSVNTNQFTPGNIPGMEGFGNYFTNFQALFSYIADETVSAGSVGMNPNKGTKMTLRCTACIMGVNKGMLELRDYKILQTTVE